jgi:phage terminase Nu1 subunit (DNA packaging protein)
MARKATTARTENPPSPAQEDHIPGTCTVADLAEMLDCTTRTVEKYAQQGLIVRVSRGRYHLAQSVKKVVNYLRAQAASQRSASGHDSVEESVLLKRTQRRLAEIRVAELEGTVIPVSDVEEAWTTLVVQNRQLVMSIPGRIRMEIPNISGHEQKLIQRLCHDLLTETALGTGKMPSNKTRRLETTL